MQIYPLGEQELETLRQHLTEPQESKDFKKDRKPLPLMTEMIRMTASRATTSGRVKSEDNVLHGIQEVRIGGAGGAIPGGRTSATHAGA